ncbi:MAG: DegV family protein [Lachnospiraceae bacterium]|nr:DegV family protein [Lachnospiraceae bacterium]
MKIGIVTDSSSGILKNEAESLGIYVVPMPFYLDDKQYYEDVNMNRDEFYDKLSKASSVKTSTSTFDVVGDVWDKALEKYDHILHIPLTSGMSGTYGSAVLLADDDKYKGKVTCIDGRGVSVILHYEVLDALKMVEKGLSPLEIKTKIEGNRKNQSIYICIDTLDYLVKGGRINKNVAMIGSLLRIKPVMYSDGGNFELSKKIRLLSHARETIMASIEETICEKFDDMDNNKYSIGIAHTNLRDESMVFKGEMQKQFAGLGREIIVDELSEFIACHIGPGAIGAAIYKNIEI